jgi:hypothetical protein
MSDRSPGCFSRSGVALVQFWPDWTMILATLAIFVGGQFIEGNILSPKLVGTAVGLHPVWLMFALLAFGSLFGFVGCSSRCHWRPPPASSPALRSSATWLAPSTAARLLAAGAEAEL